MVLLESNLKCERVVVTPEESVTEPDPTPLVSSDNDPLVIVTEEPSLSTQIPSVTAPLESIVSVALFQPGSLPELRSE